MFEREIFAEALKRNPGAERQVFLNEACGLDEQRRQRIESLLDAHGEAGSFFADALDATSASTHVAEGPGTTIGLYKLLQQIGEGGMGVVFMAEQQEPIRRRVALKIIKPGMDSRQVVARFEAERQALAMMDHPNVAKVLDAGATENGRPYFAMELVKGVPITQYCDDHRLSPRERLKLFSSVCDAVQHAHQKGLIHRDIKPTNVLVAEYDHQAVPKIIDFGVAKALNQQLTEKTMFTQYGQIIGTPEYMSPEQAKFNQLDIDTRSDIYSLGVLLYELLAGETPFDRERLRSAAFDELVRIIREEDPPKPSTRVRNSATLPAIAAARQLAAPKMRALLEGELDWIIMKALDKDRGRRYDSARDFALDIQRYLNNEPVHATSPSALYKLTKAYQHNKGVVAALATIFMLLILGSAGTSIGWYRAYRTQKVLKSALRDKTELLTENVRLVDNLRSEKERADKTAKKAEHEAAVAKAINDFLNHDLLAAAEPSPEFGIETDASVKDLLARAAKTLEEGSPANSRFVNEPKVKASIHLTIGSAFQALGEFDKAEEQMLTAQRLCQTLREPDEAQNLNVLEALADLCLWQGFSDSDDHKYRESETLARRVYEGRKRVLGEQAFETLKARGAIAFALYYQNRDQEAERIQREVIKCVEREYGEDDPRLQGLYYMLGAMVSRTGNADATIECMLKALGEKTIAINTHKKSAHALRAYTAIGTALLEKGDFEDAQRVCEYVVNMSDSILGEDHAQTLTCLRDLAMVYFHWGEYDRAESVFRREYESRRKIYGAMDVKCAAAAQNLAASCERQGKLSEAEKYWRLAWDATRATGNPSEANTRFNSLRGVLRKQGRFEDVHALDDELLAECRRPITKDDAEHFKFAANTVNWLRQQNMYEECESLARDLLAAHQYPTEDVRQEHNWVKGIYGESLVKLGRLDESEEILRDCVATSRRLYAEDDYRAYWAVSILGECLAQKGQIEEAEELLFTGLESLVRLNSKWGPINAAYRRLLKFYRDHPDRRGTIRGRYNEAISNGNEAHLKFANHCVELLVELGMYGDAESDARKLLAKQREIGIENRKFEAWTLGSLCTAMIQQGKYSDADPNLLEFKILQQQEFPAQNALWYWPLSLLGECRAGQGRLEEAENLLLAGMAGVAARGDADTSWRCVNQLVRFYRAYSVPSGGMELKKRCRTMLDEESVDSLDAVGVATLVLIELGDCESAEEFAQRRLEVQRKHKRTDAWDIAWSYGMLGEALVKQERYGEAEAALLECERYQREWCTEYSKTWYWPVWLIGECRLGQRRYVESERLLLRAFNGTKCFGSGTQDDFRKECKVASSLVRLYDQWHAAEPDQGHDQMAREWRERLTKYTEVMKEMKSDWLLSNQR